jgi:hypothetical protein
MTGPAYRRAVSDGVLLPPLAVNTVACTLFLLAVGWTLVPAPVSGSAPRRWRWPPPSASAGAGGRICAGPSEPIGHPGRLAGRRSPFHRSLKDLCDGRVQLSVELIVGLLVRQSL